MPIILPEPFSLDDRTVAISDVATMIEDAMMGDEPISIYELAEEIVDCLRPPVRSGPPLTAIREWQARAEAGDADDTNVVAIDRPKPRIRVRAATQRLA